MESKEAFEKIIAQLTESHDAIEGKLFGKTVVKFGKKAGIALYNDDIVFKLAMNSDERDEALSLEGSILWDPSGKGKAMKEWIQVPLIHEDKFESFAIYAANYVLSQ